MTALSHLHQIDSYLHLTEDRAPLFLSEGPAADPAMIDAPMERSEEGTETMGSSSMPAVWVGLGERGAEPVPSPLLAPIVLALHHKGVELVVAPPPAPSAPTVVALPTYRRTFTQRCSSLYVTFSCSFLLCPRSTYLVILFVHTCHVRR
jgi:hypothetical protein